jgi:hypothetical protein
MHRSHVLRVLWVLLLALSQLCACRGGGNIGVRSGSTLNDNIEEPIPSVAQQFSPLLSRSNELVTMLHAGKLREFYDAGTEESLKKLMSYTDLERFYTKVVSAAGAPKSFLANQWNFRGHAGSDGAYVTCKKIVTHERGTVYYGLTFASEHATKLIGLQFMPRATTGPYGP